MPDFRVKGETVTFWAIVRPRAGRERLDLDSSGELRLAVSAPPVKGLANEACVRFLARALGLPRQCVEIVSGGKARRKLIRISGGSAKGTIERLNGLAKKAG